jgi:hypothetical protein
VRVPCAVSNEAVSRLRGVEQLDPIDRGDNFAASQKFFQIIAAIEFVIRQNAFPETERSAL